MAARIGEVRLHDGVRRQSLRHADQEIKRIARRVHHDAVDRVDPVVGARKGDCPGAIAVLRKDAHLERAGTGQEIAFRRHRGADADCHAVEILGHLDVARRTVVGHAQPGRARQRVVPERRRAGHAVVDERPFDDERVRQRLHRIERRTAHRHPVGPGLPVAVIEKLEFDQPRSGAPARQASAGTIPGKCQRRSEQRAGRWMGRVGPARSGPARSESPPAAAVRPGFGDQLQPQPPPPPP